MHASRSSWFLILVFVQAAHSIEEYLGELWNVFPPAVYLTSLVSDDRQFGFVVINIGLFVIGIILWFLFVRHENSPFKAIIWFWIILELSNGVVHTGWSISQGSYTPGVITAPILFIVALILLRSHLRTERNTARA